MIEFFKTHHVHVTLNAVLIAAAAASLLVGVAGVWCLWRVRRLLAVVPQIQDRLSVVANSVSLLADTTEACFKAVARQLEELPAARPAAKPGAARSRRASAAIADSSRQRRVVSAAQRGESLRDIAAREQVAESEVALRLSMQRPQEPPAPIDGYRMRAQFPTPWVSAAATEKGRS
jgi:hypothetical protein